MNGHHLYFLIAFISHSFHFLESRKVASQNTVFTNCVKPGNAALTFDDGPYIYENKVSDYLQSQRIKGSFFVNGYNYDCIYDKDVVEKLRHTFSQGHLIGSHTWSHPNITLLSADEFREQLELVEIALMKILGVKPKYFRPPYGAYNQRSLDILRERGYTVVNWSFDSGDSTGTPPADSKKAYAQLAKKYPAPQLTLNHETIQSTAESVIPYAVPLLKKAGYQLVSVSECLGMGSRKEDFYQWVGKPSERDSSWTCEGTPVPSSG